MCYSKRGVKSTERARLRRQRSRRQARRKLKRSLKRTAKAIAAKSSRTAGEMKKTLVVEAKVLRRKDRRFGRGFYIQCYRELRDVKRARKSGPRFVRGKDREVPPKTPVETNERKRFVSAHLPLLAVESHVCLFCGGKLGPLLETRELRREQLNADTPWQRPRFEEVWRPVTFRRCSLCGEKDFTAI
jgi:hypothetical protein